MFKTTITKVCDLNLFVDEICKIRNIEAPEVQLGCDGDTEKCIVTMVIREAGQVDDEAPTNYKPTGKNRVFTIAKVDEVPENRHNVVKLLDSLNLPEFKKDFQITCDLKLINIVAGIQSCSSLYSCPYCEGSKVAERIHKFKIS